MKAWLIRVVINLCKNLKKSSWHCKNQILFDDWKPFSEKQQETLVELWKLPQNYRNVIYLYYYEGYNISEIAKILDKKENTISSQLTRARTRLKSLIIEGGYKHE